MRNKIFGTSMAVGIVLGLMSMLVFFYAIGQEDSYTQVNQTIGAYGGTGIGVGLFLAILSACFYDSTRA